VLGGLISFLGGTAFRWILGEVLGFMKARDDHRMELERLRLQHDQDRDRAQWQREAMSAAAAEGLRIIEAQSVASAARAADDAFLAAIGGVNDASKRADWIGAWNASIRPLLATVAILLIAGNALAPQYVVLSALVTDLICAVLGVFVGERIRHRGA
jgi:hypothetical protein